MERKPDRPTIFLPGIIAPAAVQYGPLITALKGEVQPLLKDLEVYAGDTPAPDYGVDREVEGLKQAAEAAGWDTFHLVGYSGGGAIALAFTALYPERVMSLALSEPAVLPIPEWFQQESEHWQRLQWVISLPPDEQMREFFRANVHPNVPLPPPPAGEPPSWMSKRPAGVKALVNAFSSSRFTTDQFRRFQKPVYLAIGSLSHLSEVRKAEMMVQIFTDLQVEVYEGRHHFDPPQRAEPERFARALLRLWRKTEQVV